MRVQRHEPGSQAKKPPKAYKSSGSHTDHLQKPVLIRDKKVKWLDFGSTPEPVNLQPHAGYVWLKSGYIEAIPWRKVRLTNQRNVDLTTNSLWAMPLNEGWVPAKARRLQHWEKLKKYVPVHKQGDVCPNRAQARASYTPLFWGHSRSIPQGMILDVQPLVKSLFCPIRPSPNGFFDSEASIP